MRRAILGAASMLMVAAVVILIARDRSADAATSARINAPAPDFNATDSFGQTRTLSAYKGKIIVLEWTNNGCPFVGKHYGSGNMQSLQKKYTGQGVVWLTVVSSAPGTQGYVNAAAAK